MNIQSIMKHFKETSFFSYIENTKLIDVTRLPKTKDLYIIKTVIAKEDNYFCEWGTHPNDRRIPLIMWDTDIRYAWVWIDEESANKMLASIQKYNGGRGTYTVEKIPTREYKKLYLKFATTE